MDLLGAIGPLSDGDIVDLGCGNGAVGAALAARFSAQRIVGIDASFAMLGMASDLLAKNFIRRQGQIV